MKNDIREQNLGTGADHYYRTDFACKCFHWKKLEYKSYWYFQFNFTIIVFSVVLNFYSFIYFTSKILISSITLTIDNNNMDVITNSRNCELAHLIAKTAFSVFTWIPSLKYPGRIGILRMYLIWVCATASPPLFPPSFKERALKSLSCEFYTFLIMFMPIYSIITLVIGIFSSTTSSR